MTYTHLGNNPYLPLLVHYWKWASTAYYIYCIFYFQCCGQYSNKCSFYLFIWNMKTLTVWNVLSVTSKIHKGKYKNEAETLRKIIYCVTFNMLKLHWAPDWGTFSIWCFLNISRGDFYLFRLTLFFFVYFRKQLRNKTISILLALKILS